MKHTATLTTLAAAALAAAIPLAAQAQTQTSTLTISVGPEPKIDPTLTCGTPTGGILVPVVRKGTTDGANDGELLRFTTDAITDTTNEALQSAGNDSSRATPTQPTLDVSWTRGSSTADNKYIQIKVELPSTLATTLDGYLVGGGAIGYTLSDTAAALNPSIANTASHAVLTGLTTEPTGMTVQQKYENGVIILSIAPSGTGDNAFLPALASTPLSLDLTLVAPTSSALHLKPGKSATTELQLNWTCSKVSQSTYEGGI